MEQATNTFSKGLQLDTNPMIQGNDSLTDCLNGTVITMNGNELILQNDMGNGKVHKAFLPAGYQPVGMKEYGGIIYVAAYNPITNKSQIGSFPSPQIIFDDNTENKQEIEKSTSLESRLIKLTDDILHAGDNFLVYSKDNLDSSNITNYNNIYGNKIKSPKNKLYTYSIGILNSQNQFVDITSSLKRYNANGNIIKFTDNDSELYKFNSGYFIPTIIDPKNLDYNKVVNIYSYKLVGPLYLKIQTNYVQDFSYSIQDAEITTKEDKKCLEFSISGTLIYNCPDGYVVPQNEVEKWEPGDDTYYTYENGNVKNSNVFGFDLFIDGKKEPLNKDKTFSVTYNKETNLYYTTIEGKYRIEELSPDKFEIPYTIKVKSPLLTYTGESTYIEKLNDSGTIELSLIGTDEAKLSAWRYKYDSGNIMLTYSLDVYLNSNKQYSEINFEFIDVIDNNSRHKLNSTYPVTTGRRTIYFSNSDFDSPLTERRLYKINMFYKIGNKKVQILGENTNVNRWILTTPLFNDCYNKLQDYGWEHTANNEQDIIYNKLKVELETDGDITFKKEDTTVKTTGKLFPPKSGNVEYKYTTTTKYSLINKKTAKIKNEYPSFLSLEDSSLEIQGVNIISDNNIVTGSYGTNKLTLTVTDTFTGSRGTQNINISRAFDKIINCKDIIIGNPSYSGIYFHPSGSGKHYKRVINYYNKTVNMDDNISGYTESFFIENHVILNFNDTRIADYYHDIFNSVNQNCNLVYLFVKQSSDSGLTDIYYVNELNDDGLPHTTDYSARYYSKLWWRNKNHEWTLVDGLIERNKSDSIITTMFGNKKDNYVYCAYNQYDKFSNDFKIPINCKYNEYYKGNVNCNINIISSNKLQKVDDEISKILDFHLESTPFSENIEIPVESSLAFQDDIQKAITGNVDGIYLETGAIRDANGNLLKRTQIYDNNLNPISIPVVVETSSANTDHNILLCSPTNIERNDNFKYLLSNNSAIKGGLEFTGSIITTIGASDFT